MTECYQGVLQVGRERPENRGAEQHPADELAHDGRLPDALHELPDQAATDHQGHDLAQEDGEGCFRSHGNQYNWAPSVARRRQLSCDMEKQAARPTVVSLDCDWPSASEHIVALTFLVSNAPAF